MLVSVSLENFKIVIIRKNRLSEFISYFNKRVKRRVFETVRTGV